MRYKKHHRARQFRDIVPKPAAPSDHKIGLVGGQKLCKSRLAGFKLLGGGGYPGAAHGFLHKIVEDDAFPQGHDFLWRHVLVVVKGFGEPAERVHPRLKRALAFVIGQKPKHHIVGDAWPTGLAIGVMALAQNQDFLALVALLVLWPYKWAEID